MTLLRLLVLLILSPLIIVYILVFSLVAVIGGLLDFAFSGKLTVRENFKLIGYPFRKGGNDAVIR